MSDISADQVVANWRAVKTGIANRCQELKFKEPLLIAVSKTKPAHLVQALYDAGQRDFGENYVQELSDKAHELADSCPDIRWHFIGHLQSNKAKLVTAVPHLFAVQTVDSIKLARKLNSLVTTAGPGNRLRVMVQVNTSGEESKSGASPGDTTVELATEVMQLPGLSLYGMMTIGAFDATPDQPDFRCLADQRSLVCDKLGLEPAQSALDTGNAADSDDPDQPAAEEWSPLKLSMGMSHDHLTAIEFGSNVIRVGSTIFGARNYSKTK